MLRTGWNSGAGAVWAASPRGSPGAPPASPGGCAGPTPAPPRARPSGPGPPRPACVHSPTTGCARGAPRTPPRAPWRHSRPPAAPAATSAAAGSPGAAAPAAPTGRTPPQSATATTAPCRRRTGTRCRASRRTASAGAGRARRTARTATPAPDRRRTVRHRSIPPTRPSVSGGGAGSSPIPRLSDRSGRRSGDTGEPVALMQAVAMIHRARATTDTTPGPPYAPRPGPATWPWRRRVSRLRPRRLMARPQATAFDAPQETAVAPGPRPGGSPAPAR